MAKVLVLPWQCTDLKKAITSDVGVRADLDRHDHLCSGAAQGRQPWDVEVEIDLVRTMCGSRTGGWSLPCVMSD
jgi:hypothetical protein